MTGWGDFDRELDLWAAAGRSATLWWRDDDAVADSPALQQMLDIADAPVALAVIPAQLEDSLAPALVNRPRVVVLQHGFRHLNNAAVGAKKSEFPDDRASDEIGAELAQGKARLSQVFQQRFLPVLTPPWNRIGSRTIEILPSLGFRGLTTYLPRKAARQNGLAIVNTHVDVIDWHGGRGFIGESPTLDLLVGHLKARREGTADPEEPTGLLTHHRVHDADTWRFLQNLQDFIRDRPGGHLGGRPGGDQPSARFIEPAEAFGLQSGSC